LAISVAAPLIDPGAVRASARNRGITGRPTLWSTARIRSSSSLARMWITLMWVAVIRIAAVRVAIELCHEEHIGALPVSRLAGVDAWTPIAAFVFHTRLVAVGVALLTLWIRHAEGLIGLFHFAGIPAGLVTGIFTSVVADIYGVGATRADAPNFIHKSVTVIVFTVTDFRMTQIYIGVPVVAVAGTSSMRIAVVVVLFRRHEGIAVVVVAVADLRRTWVGLIVEVVTVALANHPAVKIVIVLVFRQITVAVAVAPVADFWGA